MSAGAKARRPSGRDRTYAGIGARDTPADALELIELVAERLARGGWVLRTGMSPGADQAFYRGAVAGDGAIELFLPWPGFQRNARSSREGPEVLVFTSPGEGAYELASRFHPSWDRLDVDARRLLARDGHQVLGADLASPARLVVCWTADGDLDGTGPRAAGTGQALRIAADHGVRVLNLARPEHAARARGCHT